MGGVIILLLVLGVFSSLTVEVRHDTLRCHFAGGFIRRTFPLSDIEDVQAVRNPWFAGWGIRWMPWRYWLWNVGGYRAVELQLKNGKRFRIGTNEPESLVQAIKENKVTGNLTSGSRQKDGRRLDSSSGQAS